MKRSHLNFFIDILAFIGLILLLGSGLLIRYILPPGSGEHLALWSLTRHEWGEIHFWIAVFLTAVVAVHLALHWRWITSTIQNKPREGSGIRVGFGVISFLMLVIIAIAPFLSPTEQIPSATGGKQNHTNKFKPRTGNERFAEKIRGSMTLKDVENLSGVPVKHLLNKLALPENISSGQKLGQLSKKYGLEMEDFRKAIVIYNK